MSLASQLRAIHRVPGGIAAGVGGGGGLLLAGLVCVRGWLGGWVRVVVVVWWVWWAWWWWWVWWVEASCSNELFSFGRSI